MITEELRVHCIVKSVFSVLVGREVCCKLWLCSDRRMDCHEFRELREVKHNARRLREIPFFSGMNARMGTLGMGLQHSGEPERPCRCAGPAFQTDESQPTVDRLFR